MTKKYDVIIVGGGLAQASASGVVAAREILRRSSR
jgi:succinate dehydrogenase/fumarate reductase flavoprotein subunit